MRWGFRPRRFMAIMIHFSRQSPLGKCLFATCFPVLTGSDQIPGVPSLRTAGNQCSCGADKNDGLENPYRIRHWREPTSQHCCVENCAESTQSLHAVVEDESRVLC